MKVDLVWVLIVILVVSVLKSIYRSGQSRSYEWEYSLDYLKCYPSNNHTKFGLIPGHPSQVDLVVEPFIRSMEEQGYEMLAIEQSRSPHSGFIVVSRRRKAKN